MQKVTEKIQSRQICPFSIKSFFSQKKGWTQKKQPFCDFLGCKMPAQNSMQLEAASNCIEFWVESGAQWNPKFDYWFQINGCWNGYPLPYSRETPQGVQKNDPTPQHPKFSDRLIFGPCPAKLKLPNFIISKDASYTAGFNPGPEEPPLRFEISVSEDPDRSPAKRDRFCPYCAVLDPRVDHSKVMTVEFQSGQFPKNRKYLN